MFNFTITLAMVMTGMKDILARYGADRIGTLPHGGCAYVEKAEGVRLIPSCIVGVFFDDLGFLRVLIGAGGVGNPIQGLCGFKNETAVNTELRERLATNFGIHFEQEAYDFLFKVQMEQDGAAQWGQAVETASKAILASRGEPKTAFEVLSLQAEEGDTGRPTTGNVPLRLTDWVRTYYPERPDTIIPGVKALRTAYGLSLKEAVDAFHAVYPRQN